MKFHHTIVEMNPIGPERPLHRHAPSHAWQKHFTFIFSASLRLFLIDIRKSLFSDWENSAVITGWEALLTNKQTGHVTLLYIFLFIYLFIFRMTSQGQTGLHRGTSCKQFTLWALKTDQPAPEWVTPTVSISTTETHSHRSAWRPPSSSR